MDKETLVDASSFTFDKTAVKNYGFILLCHFCIQVFRPIPALQFSPGSRSIVKPPFSRPGLLSWSWICSSHRDVLAYVRRCPPDGIADKHGVIGVPVVHRVGDLFHSPHGRVIVFPAVGVRPIQAVRGIRLHRDKFKGIGSQSVRDVPGHSLGAAGGGAADSQSLAAPGLFSGLCFPGLRGPRLGVPAVGRFFCLLTLGGFLCRLLFLFPFYFCSSTGGTIPAYLSNSSGVL